ncbi:MAG: hypothetical protein CME64_05530 [Halobacteriovoraceae bacterium]|nr:hypothetical protein [Halobacteriovoraceae bacterium]|tara:strand:+ start:235575 stop:236777 length:1203 start_codon:yes stop_codon:yes gene_type:complete
MQNPFSFYVVFNPLLNGENQNYKTQAHEFFHKLKHNLKTGDPGRSHFYWGKLKMSKHESDLEFEKFKKAQEFNQSLGYHTHLFISDFHHFWVAKVESVHQEVYDKENTLPFYDGKEVEIWFKITDMDLVSSEYVETGYYLEQLYAKNEFMNLDIDSINPYLSGLRYPLIVQDRLNEQYFTHSEVDQRPRALGGNPLIESPKESGRVASNVQTYVLPPAIYGKLSERLKKKLISIEMEIYKNDNSKHDLHEKIVGNYEEILESVLNTTFVKYLKEEVSEDIYVDAQGKIVSEAKFGARPLKNYEGNLSLNEIYGLLESPEKVKSCNLDLAFQRKAAFFKFCRTELLELTQNKFDSSGPINQKEAMMVRNIILGVGCKGVINSLICLFHDDEFMDSYFRKVA